jgi:hypothetical protein
MLAYRAAVRVRLAVATMSSFCLAIRVSTVLLVS